VNEEYILSATRNRIYGKEKVKSNDTKSSQ